MMGVPSGTKPEVEGEFLLPIKANGLQVMSMGFVTSDRTPAVWRGPMASGALQQLLTQTYWQNVDYLIVDMPPGTGDIQLTMSQNVPLSGALIVTTPQDIALIDAKKGIEMFRKVDIPVLGIIENMATHVCTQCGHEEPIFGSGGGAQMAGQYGVDVLASLPLSKIVRETADAGVAMLNEAPEDPASRGFQQAASALWKSLGAAQPTAGPVITMGDD